MVSLTKPNAMSSYPIFGAIMLWCYWLLISCLHGVRVNAISPISAVGAKFFTEEGEQFFIKGIAYQLTPEDPLVDPEQCKLDAALMEDLGANAIRVYHVDPSGDHDGCMAAFAESGIYLFVDLDTFTTQISETAPSWNQTQFIAFKKVLDGFQSYDNTAGVFVGNEVLTIANSSQAAPYIKAAARDIKAYRDSKGYRKIPVGYSAADIAALRPMLQNYLACSTDPAENVDFFAINAYEWCGDSSYKESGYQMLQQNASGYPVPIFFSETGCNTNPPRDFMDQTAIFGEDMSDTWSGAIVYEWLEEANNYGLVSYGPLDLDADPTNTAVEGGYSRRGTPTPIFPDFFNLKSRWETQAPSVVPLSEYTVSTSGLLAPPCPTSTPDGWMVDPSSTLPSVGQTLARAPTETASSSAVEATASVSATKTGSSAGRVTVMGPDSLDWVGKLATLLTVIAGTVCWWL